MKFTDILDLNNIWILVTVLMVIITLVRSIIKPSKKQYINPVYFSVAIVKVATDTNLINDRHLLDNLLLLEKFRSAFVLLHIFDKLQKKTLVTPPNGNVVYKYINDPIFEHDFTTIVNNVMRYTNGHDAMLVKNINKFVKHVVSMSKGLERYINL